MARLGVIGDLVQDVVVHMLEPFRPATDTRSRIWLRRGGSAANVAVLAAARCPTRFLGCVGADATGDALLQDMAAVGVELQVQRRGRTGTVVVLVDADGERSMFPSRGANRLLEPLAESALQGLAHLHLTGYSLAVEPAAGSVLDAARRARALGARVSIDVSSRGLIEHCGVERFVDLLQALAPDEVFANVEEADCLGLEGAFPSDALAHSTFIVHAGARPTRLWRAGRCLARVAVPAVAAVRDTTGAGDAFCAGFLAACLAGEDAVAACARAHALAATVLDQAGAGDAACMAEGRPA